MTGLAIETYRELLLRYHPQSQPHTQTAKFNAANRNSMRQKCRLEVHVEQADAVDAFLELMREPKGPT